MSEQTILASVPQNTNFLQTARFSFVIPSLPFLTYFAQDVTFPGVSTSEVSVPTPFSDTFRYGDKLVFEPLTISFLVDEDMRLWEQTFQWLSVLTNPVKFQEFAPKFKEKYYDGILIVNTNAHNPNIRIKFHHCHPVTLGPVQFSHKGDANDTPSCDLTFRFDRFEFERI